MTIHLHFLRKPDFENILLILSKQQSHRPTLFEFFLNEPLYRQLARYDGIEDPHWQWGSCAPLTIHAFKNAGYDYASVFGSNFCFIHYDFTKKHTISLNEASLIRDWETFEQFIWPDPATCDYTALKEAERWLPHGMKLIVYGPGGVLENVISLVGFDRLCFMLVDQPELAKSIFDHVGDRLLKYYEICLTFKSVGAIILNDDWGFKTQTMLSPGQMRQYVFPWHQKIVSVAHAYQKPAILHSCGNLSAVWEDILLHMRFDGKHSFEDAIEPVEHAYEHLKGRIAILGGIDVDFLCHASCEQIYRRSCEILEKTKCHGYALGSGNSIPEYIPVEHYFAMTRAALEKNAI